MHLIGKVRINKVGNEETAAANWFVCLNSEKSVSKFFSLWLNPNKKPKLERSCREELRTVVSVGAGVCCRCVMRGIGCSPLHASLWIDVGGPSKAVSSASGHSDDISHDDERYGAFCSTRLSYLWELYGLSTARGLREQRASLHIALGGVPGGKGCGETTVYQRGSSMLVPVSSEIALVDLRGEGILSVGVRAVIGSWESDKPLSCVKVGLVPGKVPNLRLFLFSSENDESIVIEEVDDDLVEKRVSKPSYTTEELLLIGSEAYQEYFCQSESWQSRLKRHPMQFVDLIWMSMVSA
ncbi:hypothetical protein Tco_0861379 [Tanacetum coccineum]|uniref:Uncharacterized protein n=1 Tax=Tanacetum coccineum TaxID=301880 RepID=A0ABQ5BKM9_9ASTR